MFFGKRKTYQDIRPQDAQEKLKDGKTILLDVRTPEEHAQKHIPGSITIPLAKLAGEVHQTIPDHTTPVIVYCQSGARSARAATALTKLGYQQVFNLGGIINWPYPTKSD